jgi:hypothetical protein
METRFVLSCFLGIRLHGNVLISSSALVSKNLQLLFLYPWKCLTLSDDLCLKNCISVATCLPIRFLEMPTYHNSKNKVEDDKKPIFILLEVAIAGSSILSLFSLLWCLGPYPPALPCMLQFFHTSSYTLKMETACSHEMLEKNIHWTTYHYIAEGSTVLCSYATIVTRNMCLLVSAG